MGQAEGTTTYGGGKKPTKPTKPSSPSKPNKNQPVGTSLSGSGSKPSGGNKPNKNQPVGTSLSGSGSGNKPSSPSKPNKNQPVGTSLSGSGSGSKPYKPNTPTSGGYKPSTPTSGKGIISTLKSIGSSIFGSNPNRNKPNSAGGGKSGGSVGISTPYSPYRGNNRGYTPVNTKPLTPTRTSGSTGVGTNMMMPGNIAGSMKYGAPIATPLKNSAVATSQVASQPNYRPGSGIESQYASSLPSVIAGQSQAQPTALSSTSQQGMTPTATGAKSPVVTTPTANAGVVTTPTTKAIQQAGTGGSTPVVNNGATGNVAPGVQAQKPVVSGQQAPAGSVQPGTGIVNVQPGATQPVVPTTPADLEKLPYYTTITDENGNVLGVAYGDGNGSTYVLDENGKVVSTRDFFSGMNVQWNATPQRGEGGMYGTISVSGGQPELPPEVMELPPAEQQFVMTTSDIFEMIGGLREEMSQYGDEGLAALAAQYSQMSTMIDSMQQQIMAQFGQQMSGNDPQLLSAIGLIREEVQRMQQETLEELNARGIAQSGIYAEMVDRLNSNQLTQVQQLVSSRVGDLQNQLNSALMNFANMRISALGTNQSAFNSMYQNNGQNMMNLGLAGVNAGLQIAGYQNQQIMNNNDNYTRLMTQQMGNQNAYNIANLQANTQQNIAQWGNQNNLDVAGLNNANRLTQTQMDNDAAYQREMLQGNNAARVAGINANASVRAAGVRSSNNGQNSGTQTQNPVDAANAFLDSVAQNYPTGQTQYRSVEQIMYAIQNNPNIDGNVKAYMMEQLGNMVTNGQIPAVLR